MIALLLSAIIILGACGKRDGNTEREALLPHYDQMTKGQEYNHSLFYRNDMLLDAAADTSVIYVSQGDQAGYFYLFATSDSISTYGFLSWRSKDLVNWQSMGAAFTPEAESWGKRAYWAPEVIYYQTDEEKSKGESGKYYMFYTAANDSVTGSATKSESIGLAIANEPQGPYTQWTGTDSNGRVHELKDRFLLPELFPANSTPRKFGRIIDPSPFLDDDGTLYLYITVVGDGNKIWGMKMKDIFTPDYSTAVLLAESNKVTPGGAQINERSSGGNNVNEGQFVVKHNGKYYLTFSPNGYRFPTYSVNQAISDNPLGPFVKVPFEKGGRIISYQGATASERSYDFVAGTGHGSMVDIGGELLYFYHAYRDRDTLTLGDGKLTGRSLCVDRVFFINNGEQDILYANGPSYSLQPLPEILSGYRNVATDAAVTVDSGENADALNDYLYKSHDLDFIKEYDAQKNTATITLKWEHEITVRAVMVYNAFNYLNSFDSVDSIKIKTTITDGSKVEFDGWALINDLDFDSQAYVANQSKNPSRVQMRPGGAAIAEFNELTTNEIVITVSGGKTDAKGVLHSLMISDIVILGK